MLYFKNAHFVILSAVVFFFICPFVLFSQENNEKNEFEIDLPDQDSILTQITDLSWKLYKDNDVNYSLPDTSDQMLRYYQNILDDYWAYPHSYMDIIRNPKFDTLGYTMTFKDTMIIDHSFLPVVFTGKVLSDKMYYPGISNPLVSSQYQVKGLDTVTIFEKERFDQKLREQSYQYYVYHYPESIKIRLSDFPDEIEKPEQLKANIFSDLFKVENNPDFGGVSGPEKFVPGRKYWIIKGNNLLQFSEYFLSDNWYKGGTKKPIFNIVSTQNVTGNYKRGKYQFNTYLEWNLNLYTNPNDTLHEIKMGTDLIRSYSDFGIQAFNDKWSYSTNIELKSQAFKNYKENTKTIISAFASPLYVNMGVLGMKYSLSKKYKDNKYKNLKLDTDISPLSVKYVYVANDDVDPTRYGIKPEKRHNTDLGSTVNSTLTYNFSQQITFTSRFKYFTNFEKMEIESENNLNMAINRFFSTRLYLYLRYDNSDGIQKGKYGYLQLNELISFGINYRWEGIR